MDSYNTIDSCAKFKLKPTKVGRISLEWNVKQLNSRSSSLDHFFYGCKKNLTKPEFEPRTSRSLTRWTTEMTVRPFFLGCCNQFYFSNNFYFRKRTIKISQKRRSSQIYKNYIIKRQKNQIFLRRAKKFQFWSTVYNIKEPNSQIDFFTIVTICPLKFEYTTV